MDTREGLTHRLRNKAHHLRRQQKSQEQREHRMKTRRESEHARRRKQKEQGVQLRRVRL